MKTLKPTILFFVLGLAAYAQQPSANQSQKTRPTITQPLPPMPAPDYRFTALVAPGMSIGGHVFTPDTSIDAATAFSDTGEAAFIASWNHVVTGKTTRAVFTTKRLIVTEGETVEGRTLELIAVASLSMDSTGNIAFEALYGDEAAPTTNKRGVFIAKHYVGDITPATSGPDFAFLDDGRILSHDGTIVGQKPVAAPVVMAAVPPPPIPAANPNAQAPKTDGGFRLSKRLLDKINKVSPVTIDNDTLSGLSGQGSSPKPQQQPAVAAPPPVPASAAPKPPALPIPPFPVQHPAICPAPAFPLPANWQIGGDAAGPIVSHGFDGPAQGRVYDSPFFGKLTAPIRVIHYATDCRAIFTAIADAKAKGRFEVWTPIGFLTYQKPDGTWSFPDLPMKITSATFLREHSGLRINRSGQILLPVTLAQGSALLLATPSH